MCTCTSSALLLECGLETPRKSAGEAYKGRYKAPQSHAQQGNNATKPAVNQNVQPVLQSGGQTSYALMVTSGEVLAHLTMCHSFCNIRACPAILDALAGNHFMFDGRAADFQTAFIDASGRL